MPYVAALADFREKVRDVAREEKGMSNSSNGHSNHICFNGFVFLFLLVSRVLSLCDWVRDEVLVDLGVRLEDKTG